jgi:hypothetical protein
MGLSTDVISDQDIRTTSTVQGGELLGEKRTTSDGREYRYGKNGTGGGTALVSGQLQQVATASANHVNRTGVTYAAGTQQVTFAVGATLVSQNQYAQGYFVVNAGTGAGQTLLIAGNNAAASSGSPTVNLADSIITATSVSDSKFSLHPNPYSACIINATTLGAGVAGVPNVNIPDTAYGWLQVTGTCSVLSDAGAAAIGAPITYSDDTAGAVGPAETDAVGVNLGYALILGVSAEYRPVNLMIN